MNLAPGDSVVALARNAESAAEVAESADEADDSANEPDEGNGSGESFV